MAAAVHTPELSDRGERAGGRCALFFRDQGYADFWIYGVLIGVYLLLIVQGFGPYISDDHPFRQTQTALTARYFGQWRDFFYYTTALFFSLMYIAEFVKSYRKDGVKAWDIAALLGFGTLAALAKVTTFGPLFLVTSAALALRLVPAALARVDYRKWLALGLVQLVILLITVAWLRHVDALKSLSPLGELLTSARLTQWNFGTLGQRVDPRIWFALLNNSSDMFFPFPRQSLLLKGALIALLAAIFVYAFSACGTRRRRQVLALLGLFILPFLILTNLHRIHNYYQVANGWLAMLALALALIGAYEEAPDVRRRRIVAAMHLVLLGVFVGGSLWYFHFKSTVVVRYANLTAAIQHQTAPDAALVITGLDWSPEVPYYANRRALMRMEMSQGTPVWRRALADLRRAGVAVGAYIACGSGGPDPLVTQAFPLAGAGEVFDHCVLYRVAAPGVSLPTRD